MLKDSILKEMQNFCDKANKIIYENSRINEELSLETCTIVVELSKSEFRVYQGRKYSSGSIRVKFMTIDEEMFDAMVNS